MKKNQASLPVQQDLPVPNACAHISKASDVRAIKGLQDVRASTAASAYKTCGYAPVTPTFYKNKVFVQIGVHIKL
jgi:hypothetical protein